MFLYGAILHGIVKIFRAFKRAADPTYDRKGCGWKEQGLPRGFVRKATRFVRGGENASNEAAR